MFFRAVIVCAVGLNCAFGQGADTTTPPIIERIHPSVKSLEAITLPFDSQAPRLVMSIPSEVSEQELTNPYIDNLGLNSSSMTGRLRGKPGFSAESLVADVNAMRILAFMVRPGERMTFRLKSELSKVRLAVYTDPKATKQRSAIKRANLPPPASRATKLIFANTSKEPYEMLLLVYGLHGHSFQLSWESSL